MPIDMPFISAQFQQWEGRKLKAYIPCDVRPEAQARVGKATRNDTGDNGLPGDYTVMGASGVTIGTGCDLGQQTEDGLLDMGMPSALVRQLRPCIGLSRDAAAERKVAVIERHRKEWEEHLALIDVSVREGDLNAAKLAKITAEVIQIRQAGERKAWGILDVDVRPRDAAKRAEPQPDHAGQ